MSIKPPPGLTEDDFEAIEDAVMETARGRWFLREYTRRARAADTGKLLEVLLRVERVVSGQAALPGGFSPEHHAQALDERQGRFAEIAWTLREGGYDGAICTLIENEARALARLADNMRGIGPMVEGEMTKQAAIAAPIEAVAAPVATALPPAIPCVEPVMELPASSLAATLSAPRAPVVVAPPQAAARRFEALAELDRLAPREKARLFA